MCLFADETVYFHVHHVSRSPCLCFHAHKLLIVLRICTTLSLSAALALEGHQALQNKGIAQGARTSIMERPHRAPPGGVLLGSAREIKKLGGRLLFNPPVFGPPGDPLPPRGEVPSILGGWVSAGNPFPRGIGLKKKPAWGPRHGGEGLRGEDRPAGEGADGALDQG